MWAFYAIFAALLVGVWICWWGVTRLAWDQCENRGGHTEPVYGTGGWTCAGANPP